ncbi:MAG: glucan 1,4-alpha-glucosidase [Anaerolineales bacterium]|nr:glucan 1,4-alpha-glucosidase [Anaerolineales bacterium]
MRAGDGMVDIRTVAPGQPGISPRWTSSAKSGVGTALSSSSRVWFTISHGIVNEIYYPRVDQACVRDLGLLVADRREFFSEEKRHTQHRLEYIVSGAPAYRFINTCRQKRYRIEKEVLADPRRDVILQSIRFEPLEGKLEDYDLYVLLAPHLANRGSGNNGWVGEHKGLAMLFAERDRNGLAMACSMPWVKGSAGYVGFSDGWKDLEKHKQMEWVYERAVDGNVALTGQVDLTATGGAFVLALGFGRNSAEAGHRALASLQEDYGQIREDYINQWQLWQNSLLPLKSNNTKLDMYRISTAVIRTHEAKRFPGGLIASLSIPWGFSKGDNDLGGYHLVWPRDLVETAGALLAAGGLEETRRVIEYLQATQEEDGHWPQNMWLDGTPYWTGIQLDETAFPILLVDLAWRTGAMDAHDLYRFWPMVRKAAQFLVTNGPVTQQDRWEEDPGYSPFTLAAEIAALLVAAGIALINGDKAAATYLQETADTWNDNIERWTYVTDTELAHQVDIDGYYVRIAPPEIAEASSPAGGFVPIKNRPPGQSSALAEQMVSPDVLALVRFGLRAPDDPRIENTIKVIDALLKVDLPEGPCWRRYNGDGYGEHEDGEPFDGVGIGRPWPLLTGERAHYELAAGRPDSARQYLSTMEAFANKGGMFPEQAWDAADIPEHELFFGRATGSAMPLVWAHAEIVKLYRSLRDGRVFDTPPQTVQRYVIEKHPSPFSIWRFNHKSRFIRSGSIFRIELLEPLQIDWKINDQEANVKAVTVDTGIGLYITDLPTENLLAGTKISFIIHREGDSSKDGNLFSVEVY